MSAGAPGSSTPSSGRPASRAGMRLAACTASASVAPFSISSRTACVERADASRERAVSERRAVLAHLDLLLAEPEAPVAQARRRDRIADEAEPWPGRSAHERERSPGRGGRRRRWRSR